MPTADLYWHEELPKSQETIDVGRVAKDDDGRGMLRHLKSIHFDSQTKEFLVIRSEARRQREVERRVYVA